MIKISLILCVLLAPLACSAMDDKPYVVQEQLALHLKLLVSKGSLERMSYSDVDMLIQQKGNLPENVRTAIQEWCQGQNFCKDKVVSALEKATQGEKPVMTSIVDLYNAYCASKDGSTAEQVLGDTLSQEGRHIWRTACVEHTPCTVTLAPAEDPDYMMVYHDPVSPLAMLRGTIMSLVGSCLPGNQSGVEGWQ